MIKKLFLLALLTGLALASPLVPTGCVWEIRGDADSAYNGGGFCESLSNNTGVDYSQSAYALFELSDIMMTTDVRTIFSPTATFNNTLVGNIIFLTGDASVVSQGYYVVTECVSTTVLGLSACPAVTTGNSIAGRLGGALKKIENNLVNWTNGINKMYFKKTDEVIICSTSLTLTSTNSTEQLIGYKTTRDEVCTGNNRPDISMGASLSLSKGTTVKNLIITGNNNATYLLSNPNAGVGTSIVHNCKLTQTKSGGYCFYNYASNVSHMFYDCELIGTSNPVSIIGLYGATPFGCSFSGFSIAVNSRTDSCYNSFFYNNNENYVIADTSTLGRNVRGNTFYNTRNNAIRLYGINISRWTVFDNVFVSCNTGINQIYSAATTTPNLSNYIVNNYFQACPTMAASAIYLDNTNISMDLKLINWQAGDLRPSGDSVLQSKSYQLNNAGLAYGPNINIGAFQNAYGGTTVTTVQQVTTINRIGTHAYSFGSHR